MTITTIYHVSVDIPDDVWDALGHTQEYDEAVRQATHGSVASGSNSYSSTEEWAEFHTAAEAVRCEASLNVMVKRFKARLKGTV